MFCCVCCITLLHFWTHNSSNINLTPNTINRLTPNAPYMGRTAPLTSKRCILYIYSTNIGTEYFKHALYSPFFSLSSKCSLFHNANLFGSCIIHILYTECAKIKKKNNSGAKGLTWSYPLITTSVCASPRLLCQIFCGSSLLTITLHSSVWKTPSYGNTKYSPFRDVVTEFDCTSGEEEMPLQIGADC